MSLSYDDILRTPYSDQKMFNFELSSIWTFKIKLDLKHAHRIILLLNLVADEEDNLGKEDAAKHAKGESNLGGGDHVYERDIARGLASHIEHELSKGEVVRLDMDTKKRVFHLLTEVATAPK